MNHSESSFLSYDQTKIYFQMWEPKEASKGSLVITHGQAEHSGCYQNVIDAVRGLGISVYAWDLRGHGRSGGKRGYASSFDDYCKDYEMFFKILNTDKNFKSKPVVVLGHSMGGLIQLRTLLSHFENKVTAQVLSSPFLGLQLEVPFIKDLAAQILNTFYGKLTLGNEIKKEDLSRDPEYLVNFDKDFLRHDQISSGVYLGFLQAMRYVNSRANKLQLKTLIQIPDHDPVVNSQVTKDFYNEIPSGVAQLKVYPDRKHEIYNDLGREVVFKDLIAFLKTVYV